MPTKPSVPLSSFTEPLRNKSPTKNTLESTSQAEDSLPIFDENSMDVGDVEVGSTDILSDENADADCFDSCPVSGEAIRFYCLDMFEDANKHPGINGFLLNLKINLSIYNIFRMILSTCIL